MPNAWVEHVRKFAREKGLSYGCALSDPNLKKGYVPIGKKTKKKYDEEKKQEESAKEFKEKAQGLYSQMTTKEEIKDRIAKQKKYIEEIDHIKENVSKSFFRVRYKEKIENRKNYKNAIKILEERLKEL